MGLFFGGLAQFVGTHKPHTSCPNATGQGSKWQLRLRSKFLWAMFFRRATCAWGSHTPWQSGGPTQPLRKTQRDRNWRCAPAGGVRTVWMRLCWELSTCSCPVRFLFSNYSLTSYVGSTDSPHPNRFLEEQGDLKGGSFEAKPH